MSRVRVAVGSRIAALPVPFGTTSLCWLLPPSVHLSIAPKRITLLRRHDWVIQDVADELGKDRKQIYRWMERSGIKRDLD